jgi:hypothetical protein
MKSRTLIQAALVAALAAAPAFAFAQAADTSGNVPLTRAQVKAELVQLEQAGYNPAMADDATYPRDIQAAEARVSQQEGVAQAPAADTSGYGAATQGATQSGQPATMRPADSVYFGN